jgi:glycosyltransferase involved in cell wall biosynthesis
MALDLIYLAPNTAGHHVGHIKLFIERAIEDPRINSLHFAVGDDFSIRAGADPNTVAGGSPKVSFEVVKPRVTGSRDGWFVWKEARRLIESRPGSICFINELDRPLHGAVIDRRPLPGFITGIVLSPRMGISREHLFTSLRRGLTKMAAFVLAKNSSVPIFFTLDRYYLNRLPRFISRNWHYVPDPLPITDEQREGLRTRPRVKTSGRVRFLLFGSLGRRKGLYTLLDALRSLSVQDRLRIDVTIAGLLTECTPREREIWPSLVAEIAALDGMSLRTMNKYFSNSELIDLLRGTDVVLAPYTDHFGPSNVVLWAAAAGIPVVAPEVGWMGEVVSAERLGFICDATKAPALAETMARASHRGALEDFIPDRLKAFAEDSSADRFYDGIISAIQERSSQQRNTMRP